MRWLATRRRVRHMSVMGFKIEHRIGVARPAAQVWAILSDVAAWKDWNPMYPEIAGKLLISAPLSLTEQVGERRETYAAVVAEWVPDKQIIWTRRSHAGLVRHVRYIEIEALSETGCIFANGELYEGFAAPALIGGRRRRAFRSACRAFSDAMKARVEAGFGEDTQAWRA